MANLLFLDLETTDLDISKAEIVEISFIDQYADQPFTFLCKPKNPISHAASGITNIDNADLEELNSFEETILYDGVKLIDFVKTHTENILVCHNVDFDSQILKKYGIEFKYKICTYKLAWYLFKDLENHKLGTVRSYLAIPANKESHRAEADVIILKQVFQKMFEFVAAKKPENTEEQNYKYLYALYLEAEKEYLDTWQFGKFAGKKIDLAKDHHKSYAEWYLKQAKTITPFTAHLKQLLQNLK